MTPNEKSASDGSDRLRRALEAFLSGGEREALLAAHPDLADLLGPMFENAADESKPTVPGSGPELEIAGFRIERELGRGGMGVVYEATQQSLGRKVALKVLPEIDTTDPTRVMRFRREAAAAAALEHPGIVKIHELGHSNQRHWIAMELVAGGTLAQHAAGLRAQGIGTCVRTIAAVADALEHAHHLGVIHRDVKPANILLRTDGSPVISDFGLARNLLAPSSSHSNGFVGTPYYASPEHCQASSVDARSDVFSLGATLYVLLTGERPFPGESTDEVLLKIRAGAPRDPRALVPSLPRDLVAIVLHALERNPRDRYQSAGEFAADLRAFLAFEPIRARRPSRLARTYRWMKREPLRAALSATLLALVTVGGYLLVNLNDLRAGERLAQARELESRLMDTMGLLLFGEADRAHATALRALDYSPGNPEAIVCATLARLGAAGTSSDPRAIENARAELRRLAPDFGTKGTLARLDRELAKALAQSRDHHDEPISDRANVLEHFVAGHFAIGRARGGDLDARKRAVGSLRRATLASSRPSLMLALSFARCAHLLEDREAAEDAVMLLATHWPERSDVQHAIGLVAGRYDFEAGKRAFEKCLAVAPDWASAWSDYGMLLSRNSKLAEAKNALLRAIELDPRRTSTLESLIECHFRSGAPDFPEVERLSNTLLRQEPENTYALTSLAIADYEQDRPHEAIARLEPVIRRSPDNARSHTALGASFAKTKDYERAIHHLQIAEKLAPDDSMAFILHSNLLWERGDMSNAAKLLREVVRLEPRSGKALSNLAAALCELDEIDEALTFARKAIELDPRNASSRMNLIAMLTRSGRLDEQRAEFAAWRAVEPPEARAFYESARAITIDHAADRETFLATALGWLDRAVELDPRSARAALRQRAELLVWAGHFEQARDLLEAQLADPKLEAAWRASLEGILLRCRRALRDAGGGAASRPFSAETRSGAR